jgi:hypothetical protein
MSLTDYSGLAQRVDAGENCSVAFAADPRAFAPVQPLNGGRL